ncbi:MAG: SufD family Fe-S cluster assembly protein [Bacilli bacterium]
MNRIFIKEDIIDFTDLDGKIKINSKAKNEFFDVNSITIDVLEDTNLKIAYSSINPSKLDIIINVLPDVELKLDELRKGDNYKIRYRYNIFEQATLNLNKFYDLKSIKEYVIINLNGENAKIDYNFKTISKNYEKYDITVYHNSKNSISNIKNNGVNIKSGNLIFNVSSFVYSGFTNCTANQFGRIINLVNEKCQINPNLFIDEFDVSANHSAHIGGFEKEEIFYLNSRGINNEDANKLLITGFLMNETDKYLQEKIDNSINRYWR